MGGRGRGRVRVLRAWNPLLLLLLLAAHVLRLLRSRGVVWLRGQLLLDAHLCGVGTRVGVGVRARVGVGVRVRVRVWA